MAYNYKGNSSGDRTMNLSMKKSTDDNNYHNMEAFDKHKNDPTGRYSQGYDTSTMKKSGIDFVQLRAQVAELDVEESSQLLKLSRQVSKKPVHNISQMTEEYIQELENFQYARMKRKEAYEKDKPLGFIQMHSHLTSFRVDIEWSKAVQNRIQNNDAYISWLQNDDIDGGTQLNRPYFCYIVSFASVISFVVSIAMNGGKFSRFGVNPTIGPSAESLSAVGAKYTYKIVSGEFFRVFTPIIMHAGIIHMIINLRLLWLIGRKFEKENGFFVTAIFFCVPAIAGTLMSTVLLPSFVTVSASGGVMGIIGGYIADIYIHRPIWGEYLGFQATILDFANFFFYSVLDVLPILVLGLTPFVDNFTNMTALVYGFFCGLGILQRASIENNDVKSEKSDSITVMPPTNISIPFEEENDNTFNGTKRETRLVIQRKPFYIISCGILVSFFAIFLVDGESSPCQWCERTTCISFPPFAPIERKWWHCDSCEAATYSAYFLQNNNYNYNYDYYSNANRQYGGMSMKCPDGSKKNIDLEFYDIYDETWFKRNVRLFCHYQCDGVKQPIFYGTSTQQTNNNNNNNYNRYRNGNNNNKNYNNQSGGSCNYWKPNYYTCMGYYKNNGNRVKHV